MEAATDRFVLFLVPHLYLTVFVVSAIDAIGIPFPGRIVLVLAGAFASTRLELALAIVASALGSLAGDHVVYLAGAREAKRSWRSIAGSRSARSAVWKTR
jgi:membrane protein DedA with SNARE-associated domain